MVVDSTRPKLNKRARRGFRLASLTLRSEARNKYCCLAVLYRKKEKQDPRTFKRKIPMFLKPILQFKCYLNIYLNIYVSYK